jgi:competence protein ComEC
MPWILRSPQNGKPKLRPTCYQTTRRVAENALPACPCEDVDESGARFRFSLMKTPTRVALLLCALNACAIAARAAQKDKTLDVYWIDSEGGGSTLIVTPENQSVLIDTGNPGGRDSARIVAVAKAAGLTKLDYVLLTHYHIDHFGGGAEVAQQIPIGTIFERGIPAGDPDGRAQSSFQTQIKPWREIQAKREKLAPGVLIPLQAARGGPKLELRCIAADKKMIEPTAAQMTTKNPLVSPEPAKRIDPTDNDNSAVFVLTFGGFKFFDGGDLTWNYEGKLVAPYNVVGAVDVYQTDHHGLDVSNNPVFIQSLAPTISVMNNGPRKGGTATAFASLKTVTSLKANYQMHKSMNVPAEENTADEFIANLVEARPADKCTANYIKMSVAPDAKSYTISIPSNGHSRTYATTAK